MINRRRLLLARTFMLLLSIRGGLALLSFQRLRAYLRWIGLVTLCQPSQLSSKEANQAQTVRQVIWAVERSASLMPGGAKCLAKALATQVLMTRRGCDCELKIGVAKTASGALEAHAWVEQDNQVIIGQLPDLDRFKCLPSL